MNALWQALRDIATTEPERVALSGDGEQLSYGQLLSASQALASTLRSRGIKRLALMADNGPDWLICDLAALWAEVALIPLPAYFSDQQLRHALQDSGAELLFFDATAAPRIVSLTTCDDTLHCGSLQAVTIVQEAGRESFPSAALPGGCAKITYTSGSTGQAKGVCLSAAAQLRTAQAINAALAELPLRRHLAILPLATLLENVAGVYAALLRGGEVVLPSLATLGWAGSGGMDVARLMRCFQRRRPDTAVLLPQLLKALCELPDSPPDSLRFVAVGGSRTAPALLLNGREKGWPVYEGYGLSECGSVLTVNVPGADKPGSAGRPLHHCQLSLEGSEVMAEGNAFLGYLGDKANTRYRVATGDLGHFDEEGFLWLSGRRKNLLINSYGRNISPEWPESELLRHSAIVQCVVVGDARPHCAALLTVLPGSDDAEVSAHIARCNAELPDYARIRQWRRLPTPLSAADGLLTANGRPRREAIARHYAALIEDCYADARTDTVAGNIDRDNEDLMYGIL